MSWFNQASFYHKSRHKIIELDLNLRTFRVARSGQRQASVPPISSSVENFNWLTLGFVDFRRSWVEWSLRWNERRLIEGGLVEWLLKTWIELRLESRVEQWRPRVEVWRPRVVVMTSIEVRLPSMKPLRWRMKYRERYCDDLKDKRVDHFKAENEKQIICCCSRYLKVEHDDEYFFLCLFRLGMPTHTIVRTNANRQTAPTKAPDHFAMRTMTEDLLKRSNNYFSKMRISGDDL